MSEEEKPKPPPTIDIYDKETSKIKTFPKKPGVLDYVKEAFEPVNTRVSLDAVRRRLDQGS